MDTTVKMNQGDAVVAAFKQVMKVERFEKALIWKEIDPKVIEQVEAVLYLWFMTDKVEWKKIGPKGEKRDSTWVKGYLNGLMNNHVRKHKALNGGTEYEIQKPGSRASSGDEQLKAMQDLFKVMPDGDKKLALAARIEARKDEVAKAKIKPINIDALPEEFREIAKQFAK